MTPCIRLTLISQEIKIDFFAFYNQNSVKFYVSAGLTLRENSENASSPEYEGQYHQKVLLSFPMNGHVRRCGQS
jgi:hypothetical protein